MRRRERDSRSGGPTAVRGAVRVLVLGLALGAMACADQADEAADGDAPGDAARAGRADGAEVAPDLVDVRRLEPGIRVDARYAGSENFVGEPVDGYEAPRCLLARPAAERLAEVHRSLERQGLGLLVYDCYRPQRAVDHFVRWAADTADVATKAAYYPNVEKSRLFEEGYIARRSGHSRGSTVDLTLVRLEGDAPGPLDMGTPYDFFDPRSHTESPEVGEGQLANRLRLRQAMEAGGFRNYPAEWWHYTLENEPYPDTYFDVVVR